MRKELQAELPCHRYLLPTLSIEKENKTMTDYPNNISAKLEIIKASEITPKEVRWLWYPYIPFGKVTLLQGDPGDGKSSVFRSCYLFSSRFNLKSCSSNCCFLIRSTVSCFNNCSFVIVNS